MIVTSARSSINIRHLEKATVSTGKEGLLSEGNAAYNWSRYSPTFARLITSATGRKQWENSMDNHDSEVLMKPMGIGSLFSPYSISISLSAVFRNTMFGPEGRPHHCCAWLGVASSFPESVLLQLFQKR
ncbi:hypothetical protein D5086_019069 [Populus alba]|uniref:Uncharacterized protein n=1 Tax=Populus alba TaxID=43335 RepID=A0ACC4BG51_POPAL